MRGVGQLKAYFLFNLFRAGVDGDISDGRAGAGVAQAELEGSPVGDGAGQESRIFVFSSRQGFEAV